MSPPTSSSPPTASAPASADGIVVRERKLGLDTDLNARPDPSGEVDYFLAIPWCRALLRPAEARPAGSVVPTVRITQPSFRRRRTQPPRNPDGSITNSTTTPDNAFASTLHTADTIGAFIVFYEEPAAPASAHPEYRPPVVELKALLRLGAGMNGHVGLAHGGFVAAILDEVLGLIIPLNRGRVRHNQRLGIEPPPAPEPTSPAEVAAAKSGHITTSYMTGYLNTTYLRPVKTMATILVTARFTRMEGTRKFYFEGGVWDDKNQLLAKGECLYIALKEKL